MDWYEDSVPILMEKEEMIGSEIIVPPNSGIVLEEGTKIEKKSGCGEREGFTKIDGNKLLTNDAGETFIKLMKKDSVPVYTGVIVTPIHSIFIENDDGSVKLGRG